ncbi:MAG: hypothetical protein ACXVKH_04730 [Candidatus Angelobacter sp.]
MKHVELANEQSWDGTNYNIQDTQGSLGTLSFAKEGVVGAFFDLHSPRNPLTSTIAYDLNARLVEMPPDLRNVAEREALQYLIQDFEGADVPVITAIFWEEGGRLVSTEPWSAVLSNGAHLIETQIQPEAEAINTFRAHYDFSQTQIELLQSIFARKAAAGDAPLILTAEDKAALSKEGSEGIEESRALLEGIAIEIP